VGWIVNGQEADLVEVRTLDGSDTGDPYVLEVSGEVDIATANELERPLIGAIEAGRRPVLLDLGNCDFIDSTGMRLVVRALKLADWNGESAPPLVVVARGPVLNLFKVTALDRILPIAGTREEAELLLASAGASI
jgi:anti-sigma B factor antagonist